MPYGPEGTDIIAKLHASFDVELDVPLLRRAQQFTVNVFPNVFEQLVKVGAVHSADPNKQARILTLDPRYYSPQFGISTEPVSTMEALYVD